MKLGRYVYVQVHMHVKKKKKNLHMRCAPFLRGGVQGMAKTNLILFLLCSFIGEKFIPYLTCRLKPCYQFKLGFSLFEV